MHDHLLILTESIQVVFAVSRLLQAPLRRFVRDQNSRHPFALFMLFTRAISIPWQSFFVPSGAYRNVESCSAYVIDVVDSAFHTKYGLPVRKTRPQRAF